MTKSSLKTLNIEKR